MLSKTFSVVAPHQSQIKGADIWKNFSNGRSIQLTGRVSSISVCPTVPNKFCVPNGYKVYLYKCEGDKLYRKIGGFGTRVTCCQFRSDGKLVIVGEENGVLRMCTTDKNGYHLRKINAHKGSVAASSFFLDGHTAASIGSDAVVRLWDVALGTEKGHFFLGSGKEPAKALVVGRQDSNFLCCGNLEGCVSLFDIRQRKPVQTFTVPNAVSALAVNLTDEKVIIADGPSIRVWDRKQQSFVLQSLSPSDPADRRLDSLRLHYKTVTSLWVTNHPEPKEGEVLISASTDKLTKVTHLMDWKELHQVRCPVPLTAVSATPNFDTIIIGGEKGFVKVQHLSQHLSDFADTQTETSQKQQETEKEDVSGLDPSILQLAAEFSGRWRGGDRFVSMTTDDWLRQPFDGPRLGPKKWLMDDTSKGAKKLVPLIHETSEISRDDWRLHLGGLPTQRFTRVDHLLFRFSHSQALSAVTRSRLRTRTSKGLTNMHPIILLRLALGVIRELIRRDTLVTAVAGRTPQQLIRLFRFIRRNVWRKEAAATCLALYNCILDVYSADELSSVPEFSKVNDVLRTLSQNTQSLAAITDFLNSMFSHRSQCKKKLDRNKPTHVMESIANAETVLSERPVKEVNAPSYTSKPDAPNRRRGLSDEDSQAPTTEVANTPETTEIRAKRRKSR